MQKVIDIADFRQNVFDVVCQIPIGRATSYGVIARLIGFPNHSRLVGQVMRNCDEFQVAVPAHRVVDSQGKLVGKSSFSSPEEMKKLLESEGVEVENDRIMHWNKVVWNPLNELEKNNPDAN